MLKSEKYTIFNVCDWSFCWVGDPGASTSALPPETGIRKVSNWDPWTQGQLCKLLIELTHSDFVPVSLATGQIKKEAENNRNNEQHVKKEKNSCKHVIVKGVHISFKQVQLFGAG